MRGASRLAPMLGIQSSSSYGVLLCPRITRVAAGLRPPPLLIFWQFTKRGVGFVEGVVAIIRNLAAREVG